MRLGNGLPVECCDSETASRGGRRVPGETKFAVKPPWSAGTEFLENGLRATHFRSSRRAAYAETKRAYI